MLAVSADSSSSVSASDPSPFPTMAAGVLAPSTFNIAIGSAIIDGVIEPGEWSTGSQMQVSWANCHDPAASWVPQPATSSDGDSNTIYPMQNVPSTDDGFAVTGMMKVDSTYLYIMEDRVSNTPILFTDSPASDGTIMSYNTSGGLIFFNPGGAGIGANIFYYAQSADGSGPKVGNRPAGSGNGATLITDPNMVVASTITTNHTIFEAKIPLADLVDGSGTAMTEDDFTGGTMQIGWPICNVYSTSYDPTNVWQWNADPQQTGFYQINWPFGAGFSNVPVATIADTFDPNSVTTTAATTAAPATSDNGAAATTAAPTAPATGDNNALIVFVVLLGVSAVGATVFAFSRRKTVSK
jgi:hypothetical protein